MLLIESSTVTKSTVNPDVERIPQRRPLVKTLIRKGCPGSLEILILKLKIEHAFRAHIWIFCH